MIDPRERHLGPPFSGLRRPPAPEPCACWPIMDFDCTRVDCGCDVIGFGRDHCYHCGAHDVSGPDRQFCQREACRVVAQRRTAALLGIAPVEAAL